MFTVPTRRLHVLRRKNLTGLRVEVESFIIALDIKLTLEFLFTTTFFSIIFFEIVSFAVIHNLLFYETSLLLFL